MRLIRCLLLSHQHLTVTYMHMHQQNPSVRQAAPSPIRSNLSHSLFCPLVSSPLLSLTISFGRYGHLGLRLLLLLLSLLSKAAE